MADRVTLEHETLTDPTDDSKPRTIKVSPSLARVLLTGDRGWRRPRPQLPPRPATPPPSPPPASPPPSLHQPSSIVELND